MVTYVSYEAWRNLTCMHIAVVQWVFSTYMNPVHLSLIVRQLLVPRNLIVPAGVYSTSYVNGLLDLVTLGLRFLLTGLCPGIGSSGLTNMVLPRILCRVPLAYTLCAVVCALLFIKEWGEWFLSSGSVFKHICESHCLLLSHHVTDFLFHSPAKGRQVWLPGSIGFR